MELPLAAGHEPKWRRCVDRLSALPDSLLLHILSFLQMRDVITTALLSRKWRYLWTSTPCLDFSLGKTKLPPRMEDYASPAFIDRALILHRGAKLRTFCVDISSSRKHEYETAELVRRLDSWVRFALWRGVEELELVCLQFFAYSDNNSTDMIYLLPHCLYTCESLVSLRLQYCPLKPPARILMSSLRSLSLCKISIDHADWKNLLAGCPLLESLTIEDCGFGSDLLILVEIAITRLKTPKLFETAREDCQSSVCISAPSITMLIFECFLSMQYCMTESSSSTVTARIDFSPMLSSVVTLSTCDQFMDLLFKLRHVQVLRLCSWCIQVLSVKAFQSSVLLSDNGIKSLELAVGFLTSEFPGIFYALQSFAELEHLTIHIIRDSWRMEVRDHSTEGKYHYLDEANYVMPEKPPSPGMLQYLKTISIRGLVRRQAEENKSIEIREEYRKEFEFIGFLLKNSPVLEKLTISTPGNPDKLARKTLLVLFTFASSLLALPRTSPNARVIIEDN